MIIKTLRCWLFRLGVPEPIGIDVDKVSLATVRAHLRYLETRGVEQAVSQYWPWPTQGQID